MIKKETYYTGHLYRGSSYETYDSCGNCNGANCHNCKKVTSYRVVVKCIEDGYIEAETLYSSNDKDDVIDVNDHLYKIEINGTIYKDKLLKYAKEKKINIFKELITDSWYYMCIAYLTEENLNHIIKEIEGIINISKIIY